MTLEERVGKLERQNERLETLNRRLRSAMVLVFAAVVLVVGMAAFNDRHRGGLNIDSVEGRAQIIFDTHPQHGPAIRIIDQNGSERLRIGSAYGDGGEPFLEFYGQGPAPNQRGPGIKRITSRGTE